MGEREKTNAKRRHRQGGKSGISPYGRKDKEGERRERPRPTGPGKGGRSEPASGLLCGETALGEAGDSQALCAGAGQAPPLRHRDCLPRGRPRPGVQFRSEERRDAESGNEEGRRPSLRKIPPGEAASRGL